MLEQNLAPRSFLFLAYPSPNKIWRCRNGRGQTGEGTKGQEVHSLQEDSQRSQMRQISLSEVNNGKKKRAMLEVG